MPKYDIEPMPWAKMFQKRCKAKLKRGRDPLFHGRCDLVRGHDYENHILRRGKIWVHWNTRGVWYTQLERRK